MKTGVLPLMAVVQPTKNKVRKFKYHVTSNTGG